MVQDFTTKLLFDRVISCTVASFLFIAGVMLILVGLEKKKEDNFGMLIKCILVLVFAASPEVLDLELGSFVSY